MVVAVPAVPAVLLAVGAVAEDADSGAGESFLIVAASEAVDSGSRRRLALASRSEEAT